MLSYWQMFFFHLSFSDLVAWVTALIVGISVHECAHAWAADRLGDPTARLAGRLTLSPFAHLDPMGTLFLVLVGFGWGRPVPVRAHNFAHPMRDNALVALAGPVSNFLLALVLALPYNFLVDPLGMVGQIIGTVMYVNILLCVFNLIPVPPLDGGSIIAPFLPHRAVIFLQEQGPLLLFGLIAADMAFGTHILSSLIQPIADILFAGLNLSTTFSGST